MSAGPLPDFDQHQPGNGDERSGKRPVEQCGHRPKHFSIALDRLEFIEQLVDLFEFRRVACAKITAPGPGRDRFGLEGSDPGGHDGWVVMPVMKDSGLEVDVFDADDVGKGPVARLAAPAGETVPLLLHSCWLPRAVAAPAAERLRFADDFEDADLAGLDDSQKDAVHSVARELNAEAG